MSYHAEFGHSRSNAVAVAIGVPKLRALDRTPPPEMGLTPQKHAHTPRGLFYDANVNVLSHTVPAYVG